MEHIKAQRFVLIDTKTEQLHQDLLLLPEEASDLNTREAADGSEFRWVPYGTREGDSVAA